MEVTLGDAAWFGKRLRAAIVWFYVRLGQGDGNAILLLRGAYDKIKADYCSRRRRL